MKYYIKERINPDFSVPYWVRVGPLPESEVPAMRKAIEYSVYGLSILHEFPTKSAYNRKVKSLKAMNLLAY